MIERAPGESYRHHDAKNRIAAAAIASGRLTFAIETIDGFRMARLDVAGTRVVVECDETGASVPDVEAYRAKHGHWPTLIYDVGFVRDGRVLAAVEIVLGHGLSTRKRMNIVRLGTLCIAVKALPDDWSKTGAIEAIEVIAPRTAGLHLEEMRP